MCGAVMGAKAVTIVDDDDDDVLPRMAQNKTSTATAARCRNAIIEVPVGESMSEVATDRKKSDAFLKMGFDGLLSILEKCFPFQRV